MSQERVALAVDGSSLAFLRDVPLGQGSRDDASFRSARLWMSIRCAGFGGERGMVPDHKFAGYGGRKFLFCCWLWPQA